MDKAKRKAIIAGNWKMNKTASEAAVLVDELVPACLLYTSRCV